MNLVMASGQTAFGHHTFVNYYNGQVSEQPLSNFQLVDFGIWAAQNQVVLAGVYALRFYPFQIAPSTLPTNSENTITTTNTGTADGCPQNGLLHCREVNYF